MRKERRRGLSYSGAFHVVAVLLVFAGLPSLFEPKREIDPPAITLEIVPVTGVTNLKPSEEKPKEKQAEKTPEAKKPTPPVKTSDNAPPPPPKPTETVKKEEKPEPKKEEKKPEEKKEKPKEDDLLAVLKAVKESASKAKADKPDKKPVEEASPSKTDYKGPYDPSIPISLSVKDSIRQQLYKCWDLPGGVKNAHELVVTVDLWLNRDGSLVDVKPTKETAKKMSDPRFLTAADRALRAVRKCSPLTGLPANKYEGWSYMEFTFDPREQLY